MIHNTSTFSPTSQYRRAYASAIAKPPLIPTGKAVDNSRVDSGRQGVEALNLPTATSGTLLIRKSKLLFLYKCLRFALIHYQPNIQYIL